MAYNNSNGRSRSSSNSGSGSSRGSSSSRQYSGGSSTRPRTTPDRSAYHGPRGTQTRGNGRQSGSRGSGSRRGGGRNNNGYAIRQNNINFRGNGRGRVSSTRRYILIALGIVLAVLLVVLVSSCVRSCSANSSSGSDNAVDSRVASGVSAELTTEIAEKLDQGELLAQIAEDADQYENQELIELALREPDAIEFVANYLEAEKVGSDYGETVTQGTVPVLYCWDARWGYVDFNGEPIALNGSGLVAFSMAYMGLTGNSDVTASTLAALAVTDGFAGGDSGVAGGFFTKEAGGLGLTISTFNEITSDNITTALSEGAYVLAEVSAGTLTDEAHWVLIVSTNEDGTLTVYDPTSTEVTEHTWASATIVNSTTSIFSLSYTASESTETTTE